MIGINTAFGKPLLFLICATSLYSTTCTASGIVFLDQGLQQNPNTDASAGEDRYEETPGSGLTFPG